MLSPGNPRAYLGFRGNVQDFESAASASSAHPGLVLLERPPYCTAHIGGLNAPTPPADFVPAQQSTATSPGKWRLRPGGSLP